MSVQDNVLGAMDIIASSMVSNLKLDKTVQAVVQEVVNMTTGEYRVEYNGNIVTAFALNTDDTYSVNEKVFLKIPENDMNNKKFIEGRASSSSLSDLQQTELSNTISKEGPSWELIYPTLDLNNTEQKYCIQAGATQNEEYYSRVIWDRDINSSENMELSDEIFLTYSQNYDKIYVGADFQTTFVDSDLVGQGNYGLIFSFTARQQSEDTENEFTEDQIVSYRLDINSFTGNPYAYTVFSPQETILDLKSNYLLKLNSIVFFQENFTGKDSVDVPNICVRNIRMQFARVEDLSNTLYYLKILTPDGTNLMNDNDEVTLVANFLYKGQNILSENTCKCDWYIRDPAVVVGTEEYEKETGPGWRHLESNSLFGQYVVSGSDVLFVNKYMCKIIYNEDMVMQETVDIRKYNSPYNLMLEQTMDGKEAVLSIVDLNQSGNTFVGDWYYEYGDGTFTEVLDGQDVSNILINRYLTYATVNFYCQVKLNDQNICILEKTITSSNVDSELAIEYEGQDVFNYDANGDMPIENAEKDQTLYPKLSWRDGFASTYRIQWQISGMIFNTTEQQNPPESMMENVWVDNNGVLHFKIKQKYNQFYTNNTLTLTIITVDNKTFEFDKEIVFVKTGDQGTNGTKYISAVRVVDDNLDKIAGFNPLVSGGYLRLRNFIYKDGDLINNSEEYEIKYEWSSDGAKIENADEVVVDDTQITVNTYSEDTVTKTFNIQPPTGDTETITISLNNINLNSFKDKLIIKCKTTVTTRVLSADQEREKVILYYNFPVPIITSGDINHEFDVNIPQYIKYDSNGQNAQYLDESISISIDGIDCSAGLTSGAKSVLQIKDVTLEDGTTIRQLIPAGTFDYNNNGNAWLDFTGGGITMIYPIMMYLNTYGNEAINGWDGTNIAIYDANDKKAGYILAPQIGAGTKDSEGKFTGVVMGMDTSQKTEGLYGYKDGVNTFGVKSDGEMYLGKTIETGRIDFNGNSGRIWGGGGGGKATGMTIQLTNYVDSGGDPINDEEERNQVKAIQIGDDKFYVTYDGHMSSVYGDIGGWTVNEWGIFSPDTKMDEDSGKVTTEGDIMFWSKRPGQDESNSAIIQATQAKIGGWIIKPSGIYSPDTVFGPDADDNDKTELPVSDIYTQDDIVKTPGNIMLISDDGAQDHRGYASIGGWIIKQDTITSQVQYTHPDSWSNSNPELGMANTRLIADTGIIHTSYFTVVSPNPQNPDGNNIGRMGFITGAAEDPEGNIVATVNLGIQTDKNNTNGSIIMDANNTFTVNSGNGIAMNTSNYARINTTGSTTISSSGNVEITTENGVMRISRSKGSTDVSQHIALYLSTDNIQIKAGTTSLALYESGEVQLYNGNNPEAQHGIYARFA